MIWLQKYFFNKDKKSADFKNSGAGFTLMEIVVATTIFAVVSVALLSLFNNVLKISRRSEALRQSSQGIRDFMEFMVKEIRNGQINYFVANGSPTPSLDPCTAPASVVSPTYTSPDNKISIVTTENVQECFYLGYGAGGAGALNSYVGAGIFSKNTTSSSPNYNPTPVLVVKKFGVASVYPINPPNMLIDDIAFNIRPLRDPYSNDPVSSVLYPEVQPFVTILIKARVQLPTGEQVPIIYQTSVSSNKYDIPSE